MPTSKKLSLAQRREIIERWATESITATELAAAYGVHPATVQYHTRGIERANPPQRGPYHGPIAAQRAAMQADWAAGMRATEIGLKYNITPANVYRYVETRVRPSVRTVRGKRVASITVRVALRPQGGALLYIGRRLWEAIGSPARVDLVNHTGKQLTIVPGTMYALINTGDGLMPRITVPRQIVSLLRLEHGQRFRTGVARRHQRIVVYLTTP